LPSPPLACSSYVPNNPNPPGTQLNAIPFPQRVSEPETDDEARARHRSTCRRLGEIAEHLAELAGMRAAEQITAEPAPPIHAPPKLDIHAGTPAANPTDYVVTFARMARIAHAFVALEARLIANQPEADKFESSYRGNDDSRDMPLARAVDFAADQLPDRAAINRKAYALLYVMLRADPEEKRPIAEIYTYVAQSFSLKTKFCEIPEAILHPNAAAQTPDKFDEFDDLGRLGRPPNSTPAAASTQYQTTAPIPPF
jgi:hypothetical protein